MVDKNNENLENEKVKLENLELEAEVLRAEEAVAENKEFIQKEEIKAEGKVLHYTKVILSGAIDQVISIGLALVLFGLFDLILKLFGYKIVSDMRESMFIIIYIISNILYYPIIQEMLHGKTLGRKIIFR